MTNLAKAGLDVNHRSPQLGQVCCPAKAGNLDVADAALSPPRR